MKHKCDKGPYQVQSVRITQQKELTYSWWEMQLGDCKVDITFCPFCGAKLPDEDEQDNENYAKKSAALVLSAHLHISEQGAEEIVNMLIEAVKHELAANAAIVSTE